jgi:alanine racemase
MAVVKADGYGHGALESARAALEGGATWLGVATAAEAEDLRRAGLDPRILVMGPLIGDEPRRAVAAGADVAVWSPAALPALAEAGRELGERVRVHLKLDTGMGRLGARPEDVEALARAAASAAGGVEVAGLMTHFATADEVNGENAGFMREQLVRFKAVVRELRKRFPKALVHAANSAATLREPDAALEMVRCGIALYGCSPFGRDARDDGLRPAMSLVSYLASMKTIRSRESVGYGRTFRAARGTRIGLVPVGYGDGYARHLSNRADVLIGGRPAPVVGTISMDQLTVDLGPDGPEAVGDEVVLMGEQGGLLLSAERLAAWRGTINYEVTCSVGARVPRVYSG